MGVKGTEVYFLYKKDRSIKRGGGVIIYVRNHIRSNRRFIDTTHGDVGVEIVGSTKMVNILFVYRLLPIRAPQTVNS